MTECKHKTFTHFARFRAHDGQVKLCQQCSQCHGMVGSRFLKLEDIPDDRGIYPWRHGRPQ